jgi:trans-aconitate methyltransferase
MTGGRLKTHFNLTPAEYERHRTGHLETRRRHIIEQEVTAMAAPDATVLEPGCGPGGLLAELAAAHPEMDFLGFDIEPKMIEHARTHYPRRNARFELADLSRARPHDLSVDFAYSIDVLHHVSDLHAFAAALHQLLRSGATWLAIEPNVFHPYIFWSQARLRRAGFDEDHFRPWAAEPELRRAGFAVRDRSYALFFPGWIRRVPRAVAWIEPLLETWRLFGGSVVYRLERR